MPELKARWCCFRIYVCPDLLSLSLSQPLILDVASCGCCQFRIPLVVDASSCRSQEAENNGDRALAGRILTAAQNKPILRRGSGCIKFPVIMWLAR